MKKKLLKARLKEALNRIDEFHFDRKYYTHYSSEDCSVACHPENWEKNLWNQWGFPYDHNLITSVPTYINASPMQFNEHAYIAAQGPRYTTFNEFWQMVLAEKSELIISVTNEHEMRNGKISHKFSKFWPDYNMMEVGDLKIEKIEDELIHEWDDGREERIRKRLLTINETHQVTHLHMENWFDNGVIHPESLYALALYADQHKGNGPIIVHCAAGIGRTGTFIGFHSLLQDLKRATVIDVVARVKEMRQLRWGAVVSCEEQYQLIIQALEYAIEKHFS